MLLKVEELDCTVRRCLWALGLVLLDGLDGFGEGHVDDVFERGWMGGVGAFQQCFSVYDV